MNATQASRELDWASRRCKVGLALGPGSVAMGLGLMLFAGLFGLLQRPGGGPAAWLIAAIVAMFHIPSFIELVTVVRAMMRGEPVDRGWCLIGHWVVLVPLLAIVGYQMTSSLR